MSLPLATLEGFTMYPDRRIQAIRRAAQTRRLLATQRAHALYGIDTDDLPALGGWWTDAKRKASKVTSSVIGAAKSSGIPGVSQIAAGIRAGGQVAEETGVLPSFLRTGGSSTAPAAEPPVFQAGGLPSWAMPAGLAALVAVLLLKR